MPRLLRTHAGYVTLVGGVLALGVGINLVIFTIVNALWIRPVPIVDPERVVTILEWGSVVSSLASPRLKVFEGPVAGQIVTTGIREPLSPTVTLPEVPGSLETLGVTPSYFDVLGVKIRGRGFTDADDLAGAEPTAVISDRIWASAFRRRPDVIGLVVTARPVPLRIVGVAPAGFEGARRGERADLWIPTSVVRQLRPAGFPEAAIGMIVFARLGPSQSLPLVEQRYRELIDRDRPGAPEHDPSALPTFASLSDVYGTTDSPTQLIREGRPLAIVSGLALLVLLGGCATIAALVLTHYERRRGELALKLSLGASPSRLVLELARDLFLVGALGSIGALLCAILGLRALPALSLPGGVNVARLNLSLDWSALAVAILITFVTLATAGAVPLWRTTRARRAGEVLSGPGSTTLGSLRVRQWLLGVQVGGTTVVLVAAGLFVQTVRHGFGIAPGFDVARSVFVSVMADLPLSNPGIDRRALTAQRVARWQEALEQLPSVTAVGLGTPPIGREALAITSRRLVRVHSRDAYLRIAVYSGTPNLLQALGVSILTGRGLEAADVTVARPTPVVVTRSMAERLWPAGDALGNSFSLPEMRGGSYVVVGIADDMAFGTLAAPIDGVIVTPGGDQSLIVSSFVLRAEHPEAVAVEAQRRVAALVVRVATGRETIARDIPHQRLGAWAFSGFGLVALMLGVGGAFGLAAYLAQSRRREFGVRMALGASAQNLMGEAVATVLLPVGFGVATGLLGGAIVSRLFKAFLIGISGLDVPTYASVGAVMLVSAALASLVAAAQLRRTSPSEALRS